MGLGRIALIAVILAVMLVPAVHAQPERVSIGTYVLNAGEYDISKGTYTIDFYLWLEWNGTTSAENFEIMNGHIEDKKLLYEDPGYQFYRIRADLYDYIDVKNYPLDEQKISIKVEDELHDTSELVYVPDREGSGFSNEIGLIGWEITGDTIEVRNRDYKTFDETYSRYVYSIDLQRPSTSFYRMIIPIFFIGLITWMTFFIPLHKLNDKILLGGGTLIAAIAFHIYLTEPLPPVGYMTLADHFMISLYALILPVVAALIIVDRLIVGQKHEAAERINATYAILTLFIPVAVFLVLRHFL